MGSTMTSGAPSHEALGQVVPEEGPLGTEGCGGSEALRIRSPDPFVPRVGSVVSALGCILRGHWFDPHADQIDPTHVRAPPVRHR